MFKIRLDGVVILKVVEEKVGVLLGVFYEEVLKVVCDSFDGDCE